MEPSRIPTPPPIHTYPDSLAQLITSLHTLKTQQFPVAPVIALLQNTPIANEDIAPYRFAHRAHYSRNLVYHTDIFELIVMVWGAGNASPIHGHEGEKCWMLVLDGRLTFINYTEHKTEHGVELRKVNTVHGAPNFVDGPAIIHRVENNTTQPAVSLHLYARPYFQCDVYDQTKQTKHKISLTYDSIYGTLRT